MNFRPIKTTIKLIALGVIITMTSCKKDLTSSGTNESNAASLSDSSTAADNVYFDVLNTAFVGTTDNASVWNSTGIRSGRTETLSNESVNTVHLSCAIYTIEDSIPDHYPKTLILNFGDGCTSADGILRKGKITYVFSGPLLYPGSTATASFDHYVVNGYGVQGSYTITNNSSEQAGIKFTTLVTNGIITYPNETNYHYSHNKSYTQTNGSATPWDISDDVYSITGNSAFSSSEGTSLVFNVTTPLVKAVSCPNVSAGVVAFVYNNAVNGSIDFGNGDCDNKATVTVGSIHREINLR